MLLLRQKRGLSHFLTSLVSFLKEDIFGDTHSTVVEPVPEDVEGFNTFLERYKTGLPIEQAAIDYLN